MKTSLAALTGLLLCGGLTTANATTEREAVQAKVAKVAPLSDAKGKALCACSFDSGIGFANRVGFIRQQVQSNQVFVVCTGDSFDADGNDSGGFSCQNFYPLVK
jgi:hypothetical protein